MAFGTTCFFNQPLTMQTVKFEEGVEVYLPDNFQFESLPAEQSRAPRNIQFKGTVPMPSEPARADNEDLVIGSLKESGMEPVLALHIRAATEDAAAASRRIHEPHDNVARLHVDLQDAEDAVILIEQEGMYLWKYPDRQETLPGTRRRGIMVDATDKRLVFQIGVQPGIRTEAAKRSGLGTLVEWAQDLLHLHILKFAAAKTVEQAMRILEKNTVPGLIAMTSSSPLDWKPVDNLESLFLPPDRPARILLFLHGTFSNTQSAFGALGGTPWGKELLDACLDSYDAMIGFDHFTLKEDPLQNARQLLEKFTQYKGQAVIADIITHSRGGLVTRSLIEKLLPQQTKNTLQIKRVIFVGATNGGTLLAEPGNWETLIDVYTNLVVGMMRVLGLISPQAKAVIAVGSAVIKSIGYFVRYCATAAISDRLVPGLAAMEPGGSFITDINRQQPGQPDATNSDYYVITSDFRPTLLGDHEPKELPQRLLILLGGNFAKHLMKEANDLVVNTTAMGAIDVSYGDFIKQKYDFGANPQVYHTNYFTRPEVSNTLARWLRLELASDGRPKQAFSRGGDKIPPLVTALPPLSTHADPSSAGISPAFDIDIMFYNFKDHAYYSAESPEPATEPHPALYHVYAETDADVAIKKLFTVVVTVSLEEIEKLTSLVSAGGEVTAKASEKLSITVIAKKKTMVVDQSGGRAEINPPAANAPVELYFTLKALEEGAGEIWVIVRQGQMPLLKLVLAPKIVATLLPSGGKIVAEKAGIEPKALTRPLHQLWIEDYESGNGIVYKYVIYSEGLKIKKSFVSKPIRGNREQYVSALYKKIEEHWISSAADKLNFLQELRAFGKILLEELIPPDLQQILWDKRNDFDSIQVISSEPFIPWELIHLKDPAKRGMPEEVIFLGQIGLIRWLEGAGKDGWPPDEIKVRNNKALYVIPQYPHPDYRLPEAEKEKDFLDKTFGASAVIPESGTVRTLLSTPGQFDLLHFACHGVAESNNIQDASLLMQGRVEAGRYILDPFSVTTAKSYSNLEAADNSPIVVLNACQAGRAGYKLTGIGGFADAFLSAGAGTFIGTLWSVGDSPARTFTETLYTALKEGNNLSEATKKARKASMHSGEATWLSYVVYGHPHMKIKL